jgi:hypothetical protein
MLNILKKFSWLKRFSIMVIIAPFALLWGEGYTRIFVPQNVDSKMNIYEADSIIGYTYKPGATTYEKGREYNAIYRISSLGLRDREYGPKQEGIFRVLLLGDSFSVSHGLPIEDSLSRQLEEALQEVANIDGMPVKFEVINAAAGGYSPYNYWKAYHRWAPFFHPDVVIVGLSPDDYDSSTAGLNYLIEDGDTLATFRDGHKPKKSRSNYVRHLRKWLSWNSEFYVLLRNFLYYNEMSGRVSMWFAAKGEDRINQLQQFVTPQPESISQSWKVSFSYMDKLHEATANDNVSLLMISIPLKEEIDHTQFQRTLAASGLNQSQTDINQTLNEISNYCNARNIPFFDPRPAIKARHMEVPCYFVYDGHWVAEGIRVATASIAKQWRDLRLPPWNKDAHLKTSQKPI